MTHARTQAMEVPANSDIRILDLTDGVVRLHADMSLALPAVQVGDCRSLKPLLTKPNVTPERPDIQHTVDVSIILRNPVLWQMWGFEPISVLHADMSLALPAVQVMEFQEFQARA
jgi:hypothetical protein